APPVRRAGVAAHRLALQIELDDVAALDQLGGARAREKVARGIERMAHAHVAVGIDHPLVRENTVGDHHLAHGVLERVPAHTLRSLMWSRASVGGAPATRAPAAGTSVPAS